MGFKPSALSTRQRVHNLHRLHADGADAQQQINDLLLVVGEAVGVEFFRHGRVADFVFLPLIQHPFERAAIAEFVVPGCGRDAAQGGGGVHFDGAGGFVGFELGLELRLGVRLFVERGCVRRTSRSSFALPSARENIRAIASFPPAAAGASHTAAVRRRGECHGLFTVMAFERERRGLFVIQMQGHEFLAPLGPLAEIFVKRQPGEFALEVDFVFRAVGRVMQHGVGVMENVALGELGIAVVLPELF